MASYGAAKEGMKSKGKKVLSHLRVSMAENGGHMVEHHFDNYDHQPEQHVFGDGQGKAMMEHVGTAMGVSDMAKSGSPKEEIDA